MLVASSGSGGGGRWKRVHVQVAVFCALPPKWARLGPPVTLPRVSGTIDGHDTGIMARSRLPRKRLGRHSALVLRSQNSSTAAEVAWTQRGLEAATATTLQHKAPPAGAARHRGGQKRGEEGICGGSDGGKSPTPQQSGSRDRSYRNPPASGTPAGRQSPTTCLTFPT